MIKQKQRNPTPTSSITILRRTKPRQEQPIVNVKRNVTSVKLPTIVKKTPLTGVKSISSPYIQDSSRSQISSSIVTNQPSPPKLFKPIVVQPLLSLINEHAIKENLAQKAILKCKLQSESTFSQTNISVVIEPQEQIKTHHPLQRMNVCSLLTESARNRLKRLFNKLDTDKDGHLSYTQVQRCLPPNLPRAQMTFFRVLYDVISDRTYFGLQEFYAIAIIVEIVAKQDSTLWNRFLDDVDFNYYHNNILELLEEFNKQCLSDIGTINYENLLELIMKRTKNGKSEPIINELEYIMPEIKTMKINRLDFIALLPAIIYIESRFDHGKSLFRFRENSLLDLHIRQALLA